MKDQGVHPTPSPSCAQERKESGAPSAAFTLDTSGYVGPFDPPLNGFSFYGWEDLTPFQQGYVEALFASVGGLFPPSFDRGFGHEHVGFSDLAPEALALILKDCERASDLYPDRMSWGEQFWRDRQEGTSPDFPPLTVTLGEDGKVYLREGRS